MQLRFDRYVLDVEGGRLLRDGNELALRPKTFAVLHHLVENAGRLVSKDELFETVWPGLAVTDDVLVQSIGELRRELGGDGARLIRTIPRRGYRFDSAVEAVPATAMHTASESVPNGVDSPFDDSAPATAQPNLALADAAPRNRRQHSWVVGTVAMAVLLAALATPWALGRWQSASPGSARPVDRQAVVAKPGVAVLPFLNHGDGALREHVADGLTQDIISALGRFPALTVMSWNAVLPYKGKAAPPDEIGRALAVRYQVEGRVQQSGDRLRVTAQLVGADGGVLWSERFDEALTDIFVLQDKLITRIAGTLATKVGRFEQQRVFAKPTDNLEAYDRVLRARPALHQPSRAGNVEARALLRRAIELDPNYAAAHAALAETYYNDISMGWAQSPATALAQAEELAARALNLDASETRAHIIIGRIHVLHHRHEQARTQIEQAIAINPSDARSIAGRGNILMWLGQLDAAIEALELAQRIDPDLTAVDRFSLSLAYYLKRRYRAAIEQAELTLRSAADAHFSRVVLAAAYAQSNQAEDAARIVNILRRLDPTFNAQEFGTKFLNASDLEHVRDGLRKARL
jgi:adenylate cyclase